MAMRSVRRFAEDMGHSAGDRRRSAMRNARLCHLLAAQGLDVPAEVPLTPLLRNGRVLPQIRFSVCDWRSDGVRVLDKLAAAPWGSHRVIVRSSAKEPEVISSGVARGGPNQGIELRLTRFHPSHYPAGTSFSARWVHRTHTQGHPDLSQPTPQA